MVWSRSRLTLSFLLFFFFAEASFVPALETQPSSTDDDLDIHQTSTLPHRAPLSRKAPRPQSRDLPLLPPPLHPAPPPPPANSTSPTGATGDVHHPHPPPQSSSIAYGSMVPNNSSSNTMTASPTTPRRRMTSVDSSTPGSPIRTVYEPIGGDAIRLGDSNPLQAKDDHDGEEEGRDEMGDARMMNAGGLGGRNYTENAISRDGSVMTFHDRGTGSIRGVGGLQDVSFALFVFFSLTFFRRLTPSRFFLLFPLPSASLRLSQLGAHQSSHHHNLNQTYPQASLSSNLPDLSRTSASSPTAYPIGASAIQKDLDHSLRALLNQGEHRSSFRRRVFVRRVTDASFFSPFSIRCLSGDAQRSSRSTSIPNLPPLGWKGGSARYVVSSVELETT